MHDTHDTFYDSEEEKQLMKEAGFGRDILRYFLGCFIAVVAMSAAGLIMAFIDSPLIVAIIIAGTVLLCAIPTFFLFPFRKRKKNGKTDKNRKNGTK